MPPIYLYFHFWLLESLLVCLVDFWVHLPHTKGLESRWLHLSCPSFSFVCCWIEEGSGTHCWGRDCCWAPYPLLFSPLSLDPPSSLYFSQMPSFVQIMVDDGVHGSSVVLLHAVHDPFHQTVHLFPGSTLIKILYFIFTTIFLYLY